MSSAVFELSDIWKQISDLDNKISTSIQTEMLFQLRRTVRRATRWFLRHRNKALNIAQSIEFYHATFTALSNNITPHMVEDEAKQIKRVETDLIKAGAPESVALRISLLSTLFSVMDLAEISKSEAVSTELATDLYFKLGARLELHWFLDQITSQPVANHWQALARASFREELDWQQRSLTSVILRANKGSTDVDKMLETWFTDSAQPLERWQHILADFRIGQTHEFAKFSVALRELMLLSLHCDPVK